MPINWATTAERVGGNLTLADLNDLLQGRCSARLASHLRVTPADVESFVRGQASASITARLGLPNMSSAQEIATALGQAGATGFILGLLFC